MMLKARSERGWVLIDALIGLVIVSLALTALALAFRQSASTASSSTNYVRATHIAQQTLESLKTNDRQTAITIPAFPNVTPPGSPVAFSVQAAAITVVQVSTLTKLVPVEVTVSWAEPGGGNRSVQITGYYYRQ